MKLSRRKRKLARFRAKNALLAHVRRHPHVLVGETIGYVTEVSERSYRPSRTYVEIDAGAAADDAGFVPGRVVMDVGTDDGGGR